MTLIADTYAELSSSFTTTSTSYVKALETAALPSGGKYLVIVNANVNNATSSRTVDLRVTYNSSLQEGSESSRESLSTAHEERYSFFTFFDTSISTGKVALEIKSGSGGKATIKSATIICLDLQNLTPNSDYIYESNTSQSFNTDSFSTKESISIPATTKTTGKWLVLAQISADYNANGIDYHARLNYLNSDFQHERVERIYPGLSSGVNYMQKIIGVPYLGFPTHLGGTEADGSRKLLSLQTKDSENRPSNTFITGAKIFALRLDSLQYYKVKTAEVKNLESDGSFDEILSITDYSPLQDDALTASAGSFRTGKTLGLVYAHFNPNTSDSVGKRIWLDIDYKGAEAVPNLENDTIQVADDANEMKNIGFAFVEPSESASSPKTASMKGRTYHPNSRVYDASICLINLGSPVSNPGISRRAVLEPNRIIRLR